MAQTAEEERRQLRPYRRFVGLIFALAITVPSIFILRGIIRVLDRLPSAETMYRPQQVDTRGLLACAEDLERLELKMRRAAADYLIQPSGADWKSIAQGLEVERLSLMARCHLEAPHNPAAQELAHAAHQLEGLLRSHSLLFERHGVDAAAHSQESRAALGRAREILRAD